MLVHVVGPEVAHYAFADCEATAIGFENPQSIRRQMATFARAGIEVPATYKGAVVMALAEYMADRPNPRVNSAIKAEPRAAVQY